MEETMRRNILIWLTLLAVQTVFGMWDFAITAKSKIVFYDEDWREITTSAHQFDQLSAIAFDETEEVIYFNDRLHNNGSIFSLKIPLRYQDPHIVEEVIRRTQNEMITSIAYDPLNRNIFWADQRNRKIYFISIDALKNEPVKILLDFIGEETIPDGIAIDICRRRLYWTNSNFKNASIERVDLSGDEREIIVKTDLYLPHGIIVDQLSDRIYWVVDQQGMHYTVESANLDGSDRHIIVKGLDSTPLNLAVTKDFIFWTDHRHNAVWAHIKKPYLKANQTQEHIDEVAQPRVVLKFSDQPTGIVARTRFMTTLVNDRHCSVVVTKIKHRLLNRSQLSENKALTNESKMQQSYCLNGGGYIAQSGICICEIGYKGARCEISECHNYCVHGTCTMSSVSFPKCNCQRDFYGDRCESHKCSGFCFNDGICNIDNNGEPSCECVNDFGGERCEQNSTEICALFCRLLKHEPDVNVPFGCHDICKELASESEEAAHLYAIPTYRHLEMCQNQVTWTNPLIIVLVAGVVSCLSLILLIVHGVRRFYKPARPRIKKTFVVRKQAVATDTPLTNRPIATEQCEITIENCCNMNYCDTPCFDPKLVQQTLSRDANAKEDKKFLIHNMEDDLY
ncbi:protein cueball [Glossina fuscipes]|uniref:Protein cueball n=1 Tax=Glossina fuscipes TaxID=7396 RepID=A0A9C6E4L0_9MUSC|nr:protein cueball [Glossina fuscipes]